MKDFLTHINKHLENLNFEKDELAYLSMTGKIENTIRDKLSLRLYKNFKKDFFVLREWKNDTLEIEQILQ